MSVASPRDGPSSCSQAKTPARRALYGGVGSLRRLADPAARAREVKIAAKIPNICLGFILLRLHHSSSPISTDLCCTASSSTVSAVLAAVACLSPFCAAQPPSDVKGGGTGFEEEGYGGGEYQDVRRSDGGDGEQASPWNRLGGSIHGACKQLGSSTQLIQLGGGPLPCWSRIWLHRTGISNIWWLSFLQWIPNPSFPMSSMVGSTWSWYSIELGSNKVKH